MSDTTDAILANLKLVDAERGHRSADPVLGAKVVALKAFQQRRFSHTYADLLRTTRYGPAARFFLDELYGPGDFTRRDSQFARIVPGLVLFPKELLATVGRLSELHGLSEELDTRMGATLGEPKVGPIDYLRAWQSVGRAADRQRQVVLTLAVAERLDRLTRKPLLRHALHLMRAPARAAGVGDLQRFLEIGFDTFREMNGAREFLAIIKEREENFAAVLFAADPADAGRGSAMERVLAALP